MSRYKYPYINSKKMYAAVMGACSYIRAKGYFNKAVNYYAEKYDVDEEELAQHIRERQAAGQRGRKPESTGRKFKWFVVAEGVYTDANPEMHYNRCEVVKGISSETVKRRFEKHDWERTCKDNYGGSYAPVYGHYILGEYEKEKDAIDAFRKVRL